MHVRFTDLLLLIWIGFRRSYVRANLHDRLRRSKVTFLWKMRLKKRNNGIFFLTIIGVFYRLGQLGYTYSISNHNCVFLEHDSVLSRILSFFTSLYCLWSSAMRVWFYRPTIKQPRLELRSIVIRLEYNSGRFVSPWKQGFSWKYVCTTWYHYSSSICMSYLCI